MDTKTTPAVQTASQAATTNAASADQIAAWKNEFGAANIRLLQLPKDDDGNEYLDVIARVPSRSCMSEFEKWVDKNPGKAKEILINGCLLTGKDTVKADDYLFAAAFDGCAALIPMRKAIIKNL